VTSAAWLADARAVLDVVEAHPGLARPCILSGHVEFYLSGTISSPDAPLILAIAETILSDELGLEFTGRKGAEGDPGERNYYFLEATMANGTPLQITAWAAAVAEPRVTGQVVTDIVKWTRLPAPGPEAWV
jgi:hypothetical protein